MQQDELRQILTRIAAEKVALIERHEAGARVVSHYDFNNTYQYVINRDETHLAWLRDALSELEAPFPAAASALPVPVVGSVGKQKQPDVAAFRGVLDDDARLIAAFVQRWQEAVSHLTHARHRTMLGVVFGESREHQRLFEQAAAGFEDVLGRRTGGVARVGGVLPARWQE